MGQGYAVEVADLAGGDDDIALLEDVSQVLVFLKPDQFDIPGLVLDNCHEAITPSATHRAGGRDFSEHRDLHSLGDIFHGSDLRAVDILAWRVEEQVEYRIYAVLGQHHGPSGADPFQELNVGE